MLGCSPYTLLVNACCWVTGNAGKKMSNARYYTVFLVWTVLCMIVGCIPGSVTFWDKNMDWIFGTHGIELVYRASCALACSFGVLFLLTLAWPVMHHMFLGVFVVLLLIFSGIFIWGIKSTAWLIGFRNFARIASAFWLIMQSVSLVDFAFTLHDILTTKMDETNKRYKYTDKTCCCANQWTSMYITFSFLFCIGSIAACIAFYFMFKVDGKLCTQNGVVITLTLIMGIICCLLCLHEKFNRGFLPPSTFFAISVFYLITSLLTNPSNACNPFKSSSNIWVTILNVIFLITSGYWMAYRIRPESVDEPDTEKDPEKAEKIADVIPDEDSRQWCIFNFIMIIASLYLCMMCSGWWNGEDVTQRPDAVFNFTTPSTFWLYNVSIWVAFLLFIYVTVVPALNQNRVYL